MQILERQGITIGGHIYSIADARDEPFDPTAVNAGLLNDLKTVVNENGLSMNDKERMDIIDRCYNDMLQNRSLVQYYTNKNIGVSYLRAKKRNDLDRVMALYGSPNERYW